jgi:hypothetical protein
MACNSPSKKVEMASENVTEAKEDLAEAREKYVAEVANFKRVSNDKMNANEVIIENLRAEMKSSKKEIKGDYEKRIEEMQKSNAEMKKRLNDYQDDDQTKWQEFKTEFNHDMDELGEALKEFGKDNK